MGGGASKHHLQGGASPLKKNLSSIVEESQQFTNIETELKKPIDGSDITTPRSTKIEVQRLRKMIYSESRRLKHANNDQEKNHDNVAASNDLMYGKEKVEHVNENSTVETSCKHIDVFDDRRKKKREMKMKLRRLTSAKAKSSAENIFRLLEVTHVLQDAIHSSISKVNSQHSIQTSDDPHKHVESLIHSNYSDREVAVLVSDLSGFTSTTRKYGIVHFASIIVRMRQLVLPIFSKFNALNITTEADNFITIFPDTISAVSAALEMQQILFKYNASLSDERQHFKVRLNGIGVGCGTGVLLDNEGKLHGEPANEAYHIGEDVCEGGIVLLTKQAADEIQAEGSRYAPKSTN